MMNPSLTQHGTTPQVEATATPQAASCHSAPQLDTGGLPLVAIVGSPNVGKSVLFHKLTGIYAAVSNYPGTTVEVTRGKARLGNAEAGIWDTPGMYNLLPITEEERVARQILLNETPAVVVHVIDAKNLERMLPMTLQLLEAGLPVVLAANLMDEADQLGIRIDMEELVRRLCIPVVGTALALGKGTRGIKGCHIRAAFAPEEIRGANRTNLPGKVSISHRASPRTAGKPTASDLQHLSPLGSIAAAGGRP